MAIRFIKGDIFEQDVEAYVNPVNCVGVMGAGLAKKFKKKYPTAHHHYKMQCTKGFMKPGYILISPVHSTYPSYILHFPTKKHWKDPSELEYIEEGLKNLRDLLDDEYAPMSIAIPALGCGLGGLDWKDVRDLILKYLSGFCDVDIIVLVPGGPVAQSG